MIGRAEDLSVFTIPGDEVGGSKERCRLKLNFDAKNSRSDAENAFELPYFSPHRAVTKIIVHWANTDK